MRLIVLFLLALQLGATDVDDYGIPNWILPGILAVETRSGYAPDGSIIYHDHRIGSSGELGCCQVTRAAFEAVKLPLQYFDRCATDSAFCEAIAARYLWWIYEHRAGHDWLRTVGMYNAGFKHDRQSINRRVAYLTRVRAAGGGW